MPLYTFDFKVVYAPFSNCIVSDIFHTLDKEKQYRKSHTMINHRDNFIILFASKVIGLTTSYTKQSRLISQIEKKDIRYHSNSGVPLSQ